VTSGIDGCLKLWKTEDSSPIRTVYSVVGKKTTGFLDMTRGGVRLVSPFGCMGSNRRLGLDLTAVSSAASAGAMWEKMVVPWWQEDQMGFY
ncbi:RING-type E3 ubiquitin transferase, partial [Sarracenia purpurea var. burkii]